MIARFRLGITERLLPDSKGFSYPVVPRIDSSEFSKERFHDASRISNSSAYSSFGLIFLLLFPILVYVVHTV